MQLLKPVWTVTDGQPLMSIDVHPDGGRFATGGQGEDCGRVSIWNLKPVIDEKEEVNREVPKLLTQMDHHLGCVNCVRWSGSGLYLASGGDDKLVMIWKKSAYGGGGAIFGGGGKTHHESWKLFQTLRGHNGDILDLAWGPGDGLLATASVDNTVVVWNADKFPEMVKILKGHSGLVKGVIFDPAGKYLASQSDDKTLRVWKTEDWTEEVAISDPFLECGATTHVLRPGWSPDGKMLVSAHAMNGGGPTAQVIERGGCWKTQRDFVGHRKAVTCVRFCPRMMKRKNSLTGKIEEYLMLALGSRDRSFSVWTSALKRPLFVIDDFFDQSVLDVTWSRDGKVLLACSMDGSVAAVVLTTSEIGKPFKDEEMHHLMVSNYGKSVGKALLTKSVKSEDKSTIVIENPEMLKAGNGNGLSNGVSSSTNGTGVKKKLHPRGPTDKQIEAMTSDGKRRITPIFIPPTATNGEVEMNDDSRSFGVTEFGSSSRKGRSDMSVKVMDKVVAPNISPGKLSNDSSNSLMSKRVEDKKEATPEKEPPVNTIAVKKAPGPPKVPEKTPPPPEDLDEVVPSTKKKRKRIFSSSSDSSEDEEPPKKKQVEQNLEPKKKIKPQLMSEPKKTPVPSQAVNSVITTQEATKVAPAPVPVPMVPVGFKLPSLDPIESTKTFTMFFNENKKRVVVTVLNNYDYLADSGSYLHLIKFEANNDPSQTWQLLFSSPVVTVEAGEDLMVVVCIDGSLHVFNSSSGGEKLFPPLLLPSAASRVAVSKNLMSVVTTCANLYVWDLKIPKVIVLRQDVSSLLRPPDVRKSEPVSIVRLEFPEKDSDTTCPMIVTSAGKSFLFNEMMGTWMRIADSGASIISASNYANSLTKLASDTKGLPLSSLTYVRTMSSSVQRVKDQTRRLASISYCQEQKTASFHMGSDVEYKYWLLRYIKELSDDGGSNVDLIRAELNSLSGTQENTKAGEKLLKAALNIIKGQISLQRVYAEFEEQLRSTKDVEDIDRMLLE